jgi:cytochrome c
VTTSNVRFYSTTSFRDMQFLLDRFKATGWLTQKAHKQLGNKLQAARDAEASGNDNKTVKQLIAFRELVSDTAQVPNAEVREVMVRDTDAMIVRLGGTPPSAAGKKANAGKSLAGTGRVLGDPVRQVAGGPLK